MAEQGDTFFQEIVQWLEANPEAKVSLRLILNYGQRCTRGTLLHLDWSLVANSMTELLAGLLTKQPTCSVALSGGKTPEALYLLLASRRYQNALDWTRVHLFWGDERYVPHDDPRSNYRMAYEAWLRESGIPRENIHPMPTHYAEPDDAARAYESELRVYFGAEQPFPQIDLVLLGLGDDGHIASLFPGDPALEETARWVVPSHAPAEPYQRLTLTLPVLNATPRIWFLVSGASKRPVIQQLFHTENADFPAARITPGAQRFWWLSEELYSIARSETW